MRSTEWPTSGARLSAVSAAIRSTSPSKLSPQPQSTPCANAASGISSMRRNIAENRSRSEVRTGAIDSEQLPVTAVVTPCSISG